MENAEIQIVSNEAGQPTAVIVRIEIWREIESERETACITSAEPRPHHPQNRRLPPGLGRESAGALREFAPGARLHRAPSE
jgi:hypothetical protein